MVHCAKGKSLVNSYVSETIVCLLTKRNGIAAKDSRYDEAE